MSAVKVYYPQDGKIQVHQSRVMKFPLKFPAGIYWYGGRLHGQGRPPKCVDQFLSDGNKKLTDEDAGADFMDHHFLLVST